MGVKLMDKINKLQLHINSFQIVSPWLPRNRNCQMAAVQRIRVIAKKSLFYRVGSYDSSGDVDSKNIFTSKCKIFAVTRILYAGHLAVTNFQVANMICRKIATKTKYLPG